MTAVATGTATDFWAFYNALRDFLTTNADLVSASEQWTQIAGNTGTLTDSDYEYIVEGPGASGTDTIRVYVTASVSAVDGRYNIGLRGVTTYNSALDPSAQANMSGTVWVPLWNAGTIPYTFVGSGRRFIFHAQVSTVFEAGYAGFFLPFAIPSEYPYPLCVGGSTATETDLYSTSDVDHCHFVNPGNGSLKVLFPDNIWRDFTNFTQGAGNSQTWQVSRTTAPWQSPWDATISLYHRGSMATLREGFGGGYPLIPVTLQCVSPGDAVLGVLDGCYWTPGIGNTAGNVVTVDSVDHLVIQNVSRTDNFQGYWALALE